MGLFYTALERATKGEAADSGEAPSPAEPSALVTTWEQAAHQDLAGYPLPETDSNLEPAPPPQRPELGRRMVRLRTAGGALPGLAEGREAVDLPGIAKEQYRILRTRVIEAMHAKGTRGLLITSAGAGEGKTQVAAGLALQLSALKEGRVLLIDADLRRAGLSSTLDPNPERGLSHYLRGEAELDDLLLEVDPWLSILPTVSAQEDAAELLANQRMAELLRLAREQFDLVLLDGAPVGPVADSRILARLVGASLLVVRAETAPTEAVEQAAALLRPTLLGSVLNGASHLPRGKYGYAYAAKGVSSTPERQP